MFQEACRLFDAGRYWDASPILEQIVSNGKGWDDAYFRLGVCYIFQERSQEAIEAFSNAIDLNPELVGAYSNMCLVLTQTHQFEKAIECGEKGLLIDPAHIPLYGSISYALRSLGRMDEAIDYARKVLSFNENDVQGLTNLGFFLYESGKKGEAEKVFEKVVGIELGHVGAHRMLSLLKSYKSDDEHIIQIENLLTSIPPNDELHYALGRAYEKTKEFKKSFEHYKIANDLYRREFNYSTDNDVVFFEQIKKVFTKDFIEEKKLSEQTKAPIFIVGMPRSATSLVEQILASHPEVYGAGELTYLDQMQLKDNDLNPEDYAEFVKKLGADGFQEMANSYLGKLEDVWQGHRHVSDKMPYNFQYLGLIKILFPDAKIVHCQRDPRDVCFSIYKTRFSSNSPFSASQEEIVVYYKLYKELMAYWHGVLPEGDIHSVCYETLIDNPEESIRALLKHCDLEWDDKCMAFHKTKRSVRTASALQVRKPIYKSALAYWKNYEPYLDEAVLELGKGY